MLRLRSLALASLFLFAGTAYAQVTVSGLVTDSETGDVLPGANVVVEGTALGTATDQNGRYTFSVPSGTYTFTASFIGFDDAEEIVTVRNNDVKLNFALDFTSQQLEALEVFASRAVERKTPVAFTNVDKVQVQRELASRDVPMVLNTTPSVYATMQGGGAGDARVNVRGFNQRNVAIMINGVPVNDMENGWVYWSNWDGVGDATSSIQMQRGLSAVNLATPSIGGTMNIITDPTANARQVLAKQEVGNDGFLKSTVSVSTGLINGKYAFTVSGVRKTGDGYYDGTWTDAWAYYAAGAWNINEKQRIDFYAVGAPQRHGQNLYRQNLAAYDHEYAREVFEEDGLSDGEIDAILAKFPEAGRRWNENVSDVSGYDAQQDNGWGLVDRADSGFINERENFFHKPQVNLNHYFQINDRSLWSTVVYYSGGKGGGTGTAGSLVWDYSGPSRVVDYDGTIARNEGNGTSTGILRNSHNVQWTVGAISKLKREINENLTAEVGVDWRTAEIEHYRTVRDLLGGSGFESDDNEFWGGTRVLQPGDIFAYNNQNTVDWYGGFAQAEYSKDALSAYGMVGYSAISYSFEDFFRDGGDGNPFTIDSGTLGGGQIKGGASLDVNDNISVFANAGYVSKVPIFDGVIDDVTGAKLDDPQNETFVAVEAGMDFRSTDRKMAGKINVYNTTWNDRTMTRSVQEQSGDDGLINITGLNALHRGIEGEFAYQPLQMVRFDVAASVGDWTYTDDVSARYTPDQSNPASQQTVNLYVKDLKVGDAPQTQFAYSVTVFPVDGLYAKFTGRSYSNFYADFDPTSRTDAATAGQQVWEVPAYNVFDLNMGYDIPRDMLGASRFDIRVFANVFNVFDSFYIQDATDNSPFNSFGDNGVNSMADDAEVFLGLPRQFNFGTRITFK